jgi:hypothetical protein
VSINFGEVVAAAEGCSPEAVAIGSRFTEYIPPPSTDGTGLLTAAVWWATWVGKIVPLWPGMHPKAKEANSELLGSGWSVDTVASRDPARVADWWRDEPFANIGFASQANRILIIDLDPRHDGLVKWRALCARYAIDDRNVPRSVSPSGDGGQHLWFRLPDGATYVHSPLRQGIDRPWQVPVPPSMRVVTVDAGDKDPDRRQGLRPYRWLAGDPRTLPVAPPILLGDALESPPVVAATPTADRTSGRAKRTDRDDLLLLTRVPVGEQSYTFKRIACSLIRRGSTDAQVVEHLARVAAGSPVGDAADPWTEGHMWPIAASARRYLERRDAEQLAAADALIRRLRGTTF